MRFLFLFSILLGIRWLHHVDLVGFHYTGMSRESKWLKANGSGEFGPESSRRARSEATLRCLDYAIMDGWHGVE